MCGIAGIISASETPEEVELPLLSMQAALRHRGPDDQGEWISPSRCAALAHTRLSILDLTPAGHQPMSTPDGRFTIVFNGEIYNFRELRNELSRDGARFRSDSDTEVILQLYAHEGASCVRRLRGMFAFAIWDDWGRRCFLARDSLGIKVLHYSLVAGTLIFASEVRALLASGLVARTLSSGGLVGYLRNGSVPEPYTLVEGVRCLEAGSTLTWEAGQIKKRRYWGWPESREALANSERIPALRAALLDSVHHHFVSDVPVGVFLSGGMDSTALVALARKTEVRDLKTFCVAVDDPALDESSVARRTAEHFHTDHNEFMLDGVLGRQWFQEYLRAIDQPTIDGFNTFCISRFAHAHETKVVLSGLGGDEMFGGYPSFDAVPALVKWSRRAKFGKPLRKFVGRCMSSAARAPRWRRLGAYLQGEPSFIGAYRAYRGVFTESEALQLAPGYLKRPFSASAMTDRDDPEMQCFTPRTAVSFLETTRYMRNQLLRDSDVMSMAFGLELRVPFLDLPLFEVASRIPSEERFAAGKRALLQAIPEIPEWVAGRRKRGFIFPFQRWLGNDWQEMINSVGAKTGVQCYSWYQRWTLFVLETWCAEMKVVQV
jgi:asparagine synthase (glutamine-hydrolysing)